MNTVLLFQQRVLAFASRQISQWAADTSAPRKGLQEKSSASVFAHDAAISRARPAKAEEQKFTNPLARPLRVVRVVDAGQSCGSVGRMVISGRMADVCAELDRLAAREAALI